ncbi:acetyl-CoA carboxylase biotin carboxylase subunit [Chlamydia trachomatis]|nr:acetyl-CoA carboxylase biotin carboxylase subunit [Chlamydia trachomatis]
MILGGGPNRIGQGIEFDYCCVHASIALRDAGYETIMVNCNPETVSTDYDTSDRLYFEPLTLEHVLDIAAVEKPTGIIVHYGGQTPLKISRALSQHGLNIIGTSADSIDAAEDRERFQRIVKDLNLLQPKNATARSEEEALRLAEEVGYPLMVRPSYVLGGRAMQVVYNPDQLRRYMFEAVQVSNDSPVLLDSFLTNATELDVDAVSDGERVVIAGLMQHVEPAGIHSGDSGCSLPPYHLSEELHEIVRAQTEALARALNVIGLMNVQFAIKDDQVYILEVNPRASRTVPFVSKSCGVQVAKIGARVMAGESLEELGFTEEVIPEKFCVKEAVLPFAKFPGSDTSLGPEMHSTGEVMGIGSNFAEAFMKAQLGANNLIPSIGKAFISMRDEDKEDAVEIARNLQHLGYGLCATRGTQAYLAKHGIVAQYMNRRAEGRPNIIDAMTNGEIALVINTGNSTGSVVSDGQLIRQKALHMGIPFYTTAAGALAVSIALANQYSLTPYKLQEL